MATIPIQVCKRVPKKKEKTPMSRREVELCVPRWKFSAKRGGKLIHSLLFNKMIWNWVPQVLYFLKKCDLAFRVRWLCPKKRGIYSCPASKAHSVRLPSAGFSYCSLVLPDSLFTHSFSFFYSCLYSCCSLHVWYILLFHFGLSLSYLCLFCEGKREGEVIFDLVLRSVELIL